MERGRFRRAQGWRGCRPHLQGERGAGRLALDVDAGVRAPRGSQPHPWLCSEPRERYAFPHERSDLSHWRKRLGDKLELLLAESLRVAHEAGALRTNDLKRVTVDTTVQPKAITFPTDAK